MFAHNRRTGREQGWTLVELVIVIVVLGILSSVAAPRFFSQQTFNERGYVDELAYALRTAQKTAVASGCPARVTITATGYSGAQQAASGNTCNLSDATWAQTIALSDGSTLQGTAPSGITPSPTGTFTFDAQGRLTSSPATTVTVGGHTLTLQSATGFVQVQ